MPAIRLDEKGRPQVAPSRREVLTRRADCDSHGSGQTRVRVWPVSQGKTAELAGLVELTELARFCQGHETGAKSSCGGREGTRFRERP